MRTPVSPLSLFGALWGFWPHWVQDKEAPDCHWKLFVLKCLKVRFIEPIAIHKGHGLFHSWVQISIIKEELKNKIMTVQNFSSFSLLFVIKTPGLYLVQMSEKACWWEHELISALCLRVSFQKSYSVYVPHLSWCWSFAKKLFCCMYVSVDDSIC